MSATSIDMPHTPPCRPFIKTEQESSSSFERESIPILYLSPEPLQTKEEEKEEEEEEEKPVRKPCRLVLRLPPRPSTEPPSPRTRNPPSKPRKSKSKPRRKSSTKPHHKDVSERKLRPNPRRPREPKLTLKLRCLRDPAPTPTPPKTQANKYPYFLGGKSYNYVRRADQVEHVKLGITPLVGKKGGDSVPNGVQVGDERRVVVGPEGEVLGGSEGKEVSSGMRFLRAQLWSEGRWARRTWKEEGV